ncbi:MAG: ATP-grasp domain-containing protein [Methanomicrobiales archaeon]|nr:ATP-grasp domain-containing protein [Methanomicrobiales archaeon]MDI6877429.1 ATP-grasp domain-containing protein [Methanomicrobiales archaeon]
MKRALLAEYTVLHDPQLAPEGAAMLQVLRESFARCGYEVVSPSGNGFEAELERLAPACDLGLVIAPDHLIPRFTKIVEDHTHNIGCGSTAAAVCANKRLTGRVLASHGIAVPEEVQTGMRVIKPVMGCGAEGVRLSTDPPSGGEFGQRFIEGEHLSVSLVAGRVVGEACLYYSGAPPLLLALNRQDIRIADGRFEYRGGETPVPHARKDEIADQAARAVTVLGCQGYTGVDVVVADRVYVVDVNPRITTSIIGIAACMEEEIARILVDASHGILPAEVHCRGRVQFQKDGSVKRL